MGTWQLAKDGDEPVTDSKKDGDVGARVTTIASPRPVTSLGVDFQQTLFFILFVGGRGWEMPLEMRILMERM